MKLCISIVISININIISLFLPLFLPFLTPSLFSFTFSSSTIHFFFVFFLLLPFIVHFHQPFSLFSSNFWYPFSSLFILSLLVTRPHPLSSVATETIIYYRTEEYRQTTHSAILPSHSCRSLWTFQSSVFHSSPSFPLFLFLTIIFTIHLLAWRKQENIYTTYFVDQKAGTGNKFLWTWFFLYLTWFAIPRHEEVNGWHINDIIQFSNIPWL